jgi:hypothetical protein
MKKTILVLTVLGVIALSLGLAGSAYAQGANPQGRGPMPGGSAGPLHTYMVDAMAKVLKMTASDLQARLTAGETFYQVALSKGFKAEEAPALMQTARAEALKKAVADGVITQAQADWMNQRGSQGVGGRGMGRGKNGSGLGSGPCGGTGVPLGQGGRWGVPTQQP